MFRKVGYHDENRHSQTSERVGLIGAVSAIVLSSDKVCIEKVCLSSWLYEMCCMTGGCGSGSMDNIWI